MLEIKNISKKYCLNQVLKNISLEIPDSGITAIIGPNGCGKSTLLSIMARLIEKDEGDVYLDGQNILDIPSKQVAQNLAILRQENFFTSRLTVRDLISFGRFPYCSGRLTKDDAEIVSKIIKRLHLDNLQNRYTDELSGGQRQRVYIAMILAQQTKYVLLDEPLNNLDMTRTIKLLKHFKQLSEKKSIVIVIHDINLALNFADNIIAIKSGELVFAGATEKARDSKVLSDIFGADISLHEVDNKYFAIYY